MIVLTANICFDGFGGSVFEDQVDHFSVDKIIVSSHTLASHPWLSEFPIETNCPLVIDSVSTRPDGHL